MMACNLLPTSLSHRSCHKDEIKCWIFIKTSVHGSSNFSGCAFDKVSFAARSASSFPLISLWLGSQQNVIYLLPDSTSWHVCKTLFTRGFFFAFEDYLQFLKRLIRSGKRPLEQVISRLSELNKAGRLIQILLYNGMEYAMEIPNRCPHCFPYCTTICVIAMSWLHSLI